MDDAVRARAAARNAVADIAPVSLRDLLDARLKDATMTPGVLTRLTAKATGYEFDPSNVDRLAAGVQLIYDGLNLTRALSRNPPWMDSGDHLDEDLDILAADVLVARGFALLADTPAALKAVETVRNFGRDETDRANGRPHPDTGDNALEADVFELAIIAGVSVDGGEAPAGARGFAIDLVGAFEGDLPAAPELFDDATVEALAALVHDQPPSATSPDRIWAGSSVTDP